VRERAAAGPARFSLLVPNPDDLVFDRVGTDVCHGQQVLALPLPLPLPLLQPAAGDEVEGRGHPLDAAQPRLALAAHRPPQPRG